MADTIHDDLKKITLFADIPDEMISQIANTIEERNLSAGEILFREGEEGDSLYFIQSGKVEIYQEGNGKILATFDAGEYFGEMALLEEKPRSASARSLTDVSLFSLGRAAFMSLLEKNPRLALDITSTISARLRTTMAPEQLGTAVAEAVAKKESNTKVFLSYSRKDKEFVQKLHQAICTGGMDTWVDWDNIPLTADWWNEVRLGIENSDAFAFVISPDSLTSEVCSREVQTAVDNNKRLVPILHREPEKGNPMHEKISSHNWIFMRNEAELEANAPQMLEIINTDLGFVRSHTRLLERALAWDREKKNASFLIQGDELQNAEQWLEGAGTKQPQPTPLHIEFIQASRRAANRRQRTILTASLVGMGIAVVLAIVSFVFFLRAEDAKADAEIQRDNAKAAEIYANDQASQASTAKADADISRDHALVAEATALAAQAEAENQASIAATKQAEAEAAQIEAEKQANLAKAGKLAASGQALIETNPPLAALLALESQRLVPDNPIAQEVLSLLPVYYPPLAGTLVDPSQFIGKIAWSPSGQLASASGSDVILWNLDTSEPHILSGHPITTSVSTMAWSADGRLATGSDDGTIIVWDLKTGEPEFLPNLQSGISSLAWSPSGRLASSSWDGSIVVRDFENPQTDPVHLFSIPDVGINSIAWSPFGALASGASDGTVAIWNVQEERVDVEYKDHQSGVLTVAWSPDGFLASGSQDSTIAVRRPSGNLQTILRGHLDYVNVVAWSDDGRLASASWDKTVILWDLENSLPGQIFRGHTNSVGSLDWGPDGQLASGAEFLFIWDTFADSALSIYPGHLDWTNSVLWTPEGQLVSAGADGFAIFWDGETHTISEKIPDFGIIDVSSNNRVLYYNGYLEDRNTGREVFFNGDGRVFSPEGNFVAGVSRAGNELAIWPLAPLFETGEVVSSTASIDEGYSISLVAWSPDGNTIATGQSDGTITVWDFNPAEATAAPRVTLPGHEGGVTILAWGVDGRLASVGSDNTIIIWNVERQEIEKVLTDNSGNPVSKISWSPNGELASISGGNIIVVWDVEQEKIKAILGSPYQGPINSVAWSKDGAKLAFGGNSYNVYVYNTLYVQPPCTWLTRNMTYWEWSLYLPGDPYQPTCPELPVGTAFEDEKAASEAAAAEVAAAFLDEAFQAIESGDIAFGVEQFEGAEAQGMEIDAWSWYNLCWAGAVYNEAEISYFACERAVELQPEYGDFHMGRGISRALLGDFEGAIEDFEAFISFAQEVGYSEESISMVEQWLDDLYAGINPFDEEMLAFLRGE